jgi:acetyl-CoA synthetase
MAENAPREVYGPNPDVAARSHIGSMEEYERLYRLSLDDPETFWAREAENITWFHKWRQVMDSDYENVDFAWFVGGRLNACYNCVDRHLNDKGDQAAIIWVKDEPGEYERISYRRLKHEVARVANVLKHHGVQKGDRVCIYMPMIPELAYTMLACARIGAIHSIVFGGFSSEAIRDRILDAGCKVVITANEGLRGGKRLKLKQTVDRAIDGLDMVNTVLVARRTDADTEMRAGRDFWLDEECRKQRSTCSVEWMGA